MDEVLERGIQRCFPEHECIQRIVRRILLKPQHFEFHPKVETLASLAIKSRMRNELMKDEADVYSQYIYKLIYKERIYDDWDDFCENPDQQPTESDESDIAQDFRLLSPRRIMTSIVTKFRNLFQCVSKPHTSPSSVRSRLPPSLYRSTLPSDRTHRGMCAKPDVPERQTIPKTNSRKDHFHQIRSDGAMMYSILNQRLPRLYGGRMDIILNRNTLQICLDEDYIVAEIPHQNGIYDTFWAEKFTKMALLKFVNVVVLQMNVGRRILDDLMLNRQFVSLFIQTMILDHLPRVISPEGWRNHIRRIQPVYAKTCGPMNSVWFNRFECYEPFRDRFYWGYLEED